MTLCQIPIVYLQSWSDFVFMVKTTAPTLYSWLNTVYIVRCFVWYSQCTTYCSTFHHYRRCCFGLGWSGRGSWGKGAAPVCNPSWSSSSPPAVESTPPEHIEKLTVGYSPPKHTKKLTVGSTPPEHTEKVAVSQIGGQCATTSYICHNHPVNLPQSNLIACNHGCFESRVAATELIPHDFPALYSQSQVFVARMRCDKHQRLHFQKFMLVKC